MYENSFGVPKSFFMKGETRYEETKSDRIEEKARNLAEEKEFEHFRYSKALLWYRYHSPFNSRLATYPANLDYLRTEPVWQRSSHQLIRI